jgi:hypothetical protein
MHGVLLLEVSVGAMGRARTGGTAADCLDNILIYVVSSCELAMPDRAAEMGAF